MEDFLGFTGTIEHTLEEELLIGIQQGRSKGSPYCIAGGATGVRLDGGFDLARTRFSEVQKCYSDFVTWQEMLAIAGAIGLAREEAARYLTTSVSLSNVVIPKEAARRAMEFNLSPAWELARNRWPELAYSDCPSEVQEGVLDVVWSRGMLNGHVRILGRSIRRKDWKAVGGLIAEMQQRAKDTTLASRRRRFGNSILHLYAEKESRFRQSDPTSPF